MGGRGCSLTDDVIVADEYPVTPAREDNRDSVQVLPKGFHNINTYRDLKFIKDNFWDLVFNIN